MTNAGEVQVTAQGEREIVVTRVFDAPRRLVFEAWTKPELLKRWLGAWGGWSLAVCELDPRPGGGYHFGWRHEAEALAMDVRGVYREFKPPEKIVNTERFDEPWYPGEALITTAFTEQGGRTTVTMTLRYESRAARDGVLKSPMESGLGESLAALARLLKKVDGGS